MRLNRDASSFLAVIEANKGIVYKVARSFCRNETSQQDLIQEILTQLWLAFPAYDEQFKLTTWMYRIALNVSISFYRKEISRSKINHSLPDSILYLKAEEYSGVRNEMVDQLYQFIKELKELDRAIMILYLEENNLQEIADILGLTQTNVSTRISRIKIRLKQKFSNHSNL